MSNPLKENQDGGGEAMDPTEDVSSGSSSAATVPAAPTDGAAGELEEGHAIPAPIGNGSLPNRYRQILQDQRDQISEDGSSVDNAPRRAGSPMDSNLSVPDDAASAQAWRLSPTKLETY